jgi:hypothetical protein
MDVPRAYAGSLISAIALTLALSASASRAEAQPRPAAETFAIPIAAPPRVGDRARIESDSNATLTTQATVGTNVVHRARETTRFRFVAISRVLTVTAEGAEQRTEYTVERFERDGAGGHRVIAPRGAVVVVTRAPGVPAIVLVDGRNVATDVRDALGSVVSLALTTPADDEPFATSTRQPIGGTWAIDGVRANLRLAETTGVHAIVSGQGQLVRRVRQHNVDALEVATTIHATITQVPTQPPGGRFRDGTLTATSRDVVPMTGHAFTSSQGEADRVVTFDVSRTRNGAWAQVVVTLHQTYSRSATAL